MPFMTFPERSGLSQGLLMGIQVLLKVKLGADGQALFLEIENCLDPVKLRAVLQALETATTLDDIRKVLA